jgi:predicted metal-dependent hydrolase
MQNSPKISTQKFDPFTSRMCRDIRNTLSEALLRALDEDNPEPFRRTGTRFMALNLSPVQSDYVTDRLGRYEEALAEVRRRHSSDILIQGIILWNKGLFFEVHERLETLWQESSGMKRAALKGLIKAAGVYVHREQGHHRPAETLAAKASALLRENGQTLPSSINLSELIEQLERQDPVPPKLSLPDKD